MIGRGPVRRGVVLPLALALLAAVGVTVAALAWGTRARATADRRAESADAAFVRAESALVAAPCPGGPPGDAWSADVPSPTGRLDVRVVRATGSCWITVAADGMPLVGVVRDVTWDTITPAAGVATVGLTTSDSWTDYSVVAAPADPPSRRWPAGPSWVDLR